MDFNEETIKFSGSFFPNEKNNSQIESDLKNINTANVQIINNFINNNSYNNRNNNKYNNNKDIKNNKIICTCPKSKCIKKYCTCFANGKFCDGCECKDCENKPNILNKNNINNENNENNINFENNSNLNKNNNVNNQKEICNCTKSKCIQKYCECYKKGIACGILCRCVDCENKISNKNVLNNFNNKNKNIVPEKIITTSPFEKKIIKNNMKLDCYAFGIFIENEKLKIDKRILDLSETKIDLKKNMNILNETPKLNNKKRLRVKNESINVKTCPTSNSNSSKRKHQNFGISNVNKNVKKKILQFS